MTGQELHEKGDCQAKTEKSELSERLDEVKITIHQSDEAVDQTPEGSNSSADKEREERNTAKEALVRTLDQVVVRNEAAILQQINKLCDELEGLIRGDVEKGRAREREISEELQPLFAQLPQPRSAGGRRLENRFRKLQRNFAVQLHQLYQARDLERWEHYTLKLDLCKELEVLLNFPDKKLVDAARRQREIRIRYQKIGSVPLQKADELHKQYKELDSRLRKRLDEYFAKLEEERTAADQAKEFLAQKAEALAESTKWEKTAAALKALQNEWKQQGPGHRNIDKELYARFRGACDQFFTARSEYYRNRRSAVDEANSLKATLCTEAEALAEIPFNEARHQAAILRQRWQEIPTIGHSDHELYLRFKKALDLVYERYREFLRSDKSRREELLEELAQLLSTLNDVQDYEAAGELEKRVDAWKKEWDSLGTLPREALISVQQKRRQLLEEFEQKLKLVANWAIYQNIAEQLDQEQACLEELRALCGGRLQAPAAQSPLEEFWRSLPEENRAGELCKALASNHAEREKICRKLEAQLSGKAGKGDNIELDSDLAAELQQAMAGDFSFRSEKDDSSWQKYAEQYMNTAWALPESMIELNSRFLKLVEQLCNQQNQSSRVENRNI